MDVIAALTNLQAPDLLIIGIILAVLTLPALIAVPIVLLIIRRQKKPPPLPPSKRDT
jgi:hypothetical protein